MFGGTMSHLQTSTGSAEPHCQAPDPPHPVHRSALCDFETVGQKYMTAAKSKSNDAAALCFSAACRNLTTLSFVAARKGC